MEAVSEGVEFVSNSEEETKILACVIFGKVRSEFVPDGSFLVLLEGELGSGKTSFVKGFANVFGIPEDAITSPTFTIMQEYVSDTGKILHIDLYRLSDEDDLTEVLAFAVEKLQEKYLVIFEWGEKIESYLTHLSYAKVKIEFGEELNQRFITLYIHKVR